ncbi:hypothetical protein RIF29_24537 [Crotalaria pallida]|uniref:F-box domain-containing protein n=1 Tax=Crotalaria pallida TaxID=3830 RepID=A0AAN9EQ48_CROPI
MEQKKMESSLPEDLVHDEILVRLPTRSLMRFKCVDPSWNALFNTDTFLMRHTLMQMREERNMIFDKLVLWNAATRALMKEKGNEEVEDRKNLKRKRCESEEHVTVVVN